MFINLISNSIPEVILLCSAMSVLLLGAFFNNKNSTSLFGISQITLLACAFLTSQGWMQEKIYSFNDMFVNDSLTIYLKLLSYFSLSIVYIYSRKFLFNKNLLNGEYFSLTLFSLLGINLIISSSNLLTLYMGLELLSLSLYTLVAYDKKNKDASEAAMKYFILGAVASGILLYGFSIIYGLTGSLNIHEISYALSNKELDPYVMSFALVFIVVAIAFKFGAAPFQIWVPDVYQGAQTPITLFISSVPKFASVAMLVRLLYQSMDVLVFDWQKLLLIMALLSMMIGNITAIAQINIKRLLAYSTISHVGFIMLGLSTGAVSGLAAALFYIAAYMLMTLAAFGLIIFLNSEKNSVDNIHDLAGLSYRHPWVAFLIMITFLSLAGIPPTIGFYAKFSVIQSAIQFGWIWPSVFAVMMALIGIFYYLRIIKIVYFDNPKNSTKLKLKNEYDFKLVLTFNVLGLIFVGIFPNILMSVSTLSAALIF